MRKRYLQSGSPLVCLFAFAIISQTLVSQTKVHAAPLVRILPAPRAQQIPCFSCYDCFSTIIRKCAPMSINIKYGLSRCLTSPIQNPALSRKH